VLHRWRAELGEEPFWRGVRQYLASVGARGARTLDLRRALEAASGRDLADFFERWIYTPAADP
jgi:aminopeptidase N